MPSRAGKLIVAGHHDAAQISYCSRENTVSLLSVLTDRYGKLKNFSRNDRLWHINVFIRRGRTQ